MTYKHDRRLHRHRCAGCNRIVNDGETVLMCKTLGKKTRVAHVECSQRKHGTAECKWTLADAMACWGTEYLRAIGFKLPAHPMAIAA